MSRGKGSRRSSYGGFAITDQCVLHRASRGPKKRWGGGAILTSIFKYSTIILTTILIFSLLGKKCCRDSFLNDGGSYGKEKNAEC